MNNKSMTALVSAFSRAYHFKNNTVRIFNDSIASSLISDEEYNMISHNMSKGINFFKPDFSGSQEQALRYVVDNYLSPSPLGRAAFCEDLFNSYISYKDIQYLIFAAGYDTSAYKQLKNSNNIQFFEIDHPLTALDKKQRLEKSNIKIPNNTHYIEADFTQNNWFLSLTTNNFFDKSKISFCSLLGLSYYLSVDSFKNMLSSINSIISKKSLIIFDYPDENSYTEHAGERAKKQSMLAKGADESMLASYSFKDMTNILSECGFSIYKHLTPTEITDKYFSEYNKHNPLHPMSAFDNVNYCAAIKE